MVIRYFIHEVSTKKKMDQIISILIDKNATDVYNCSNNSNYIIRDLYIVPTLTKLYRIDACTVDGNYFLYRTNYERIREMRTLNCDGVLQLGLYYS